MRRGRNVNGQERREMRTYFVELSGAPPVAFRSPSWFLG